MKFLRALAVISLFYVHALSSPAQPSSVQQLQLNQQNTQQQLPLPGLRPGTNAPELYAGENADIGPQSILRLNPRPKYFDASFDSQVYYSDNANFADVADRLGSFIYVNTLQLAITPPVINLGPGTLAPSIGFASLWYNYDSHQMAALDFDAQTIFAGAKYTTGCWQAYLGANYTRLLTQGHYDQTYREFLPSFTVQRFIPLNHSMLLAIGDTVDYHFSKVPETLGQQPDINDHFDDAVFLTFNWQLNPQFALQPFYRFQYSYYPNDPISQTSGRGDFVNSFGVTAIYAFNEYISARVFFNYNTRQSDDSAANYDEVNGGIGASLDIKF